MLSKSRLPQVSLIVALAAGLAAGGALAQPSKGGGKIVCWKDESGKVIGCGDRVPPEYQDAATKELDKRGVTRKTTVSAEEQARREAERAAKDRENSRRDAEERRRIEELRRQDMALLNTFANEKEIDLKRDRDLAVIDSQLNQLRVALKSHVMRRDEVRKGGGKDELARANDTVAKAERSVKDKEQEKEETRKRYAEMKARYMKLKGVGGATAAKK